jgi:hypothetical protein
MIQPILHLHVCADSAPAKSTTLEFATAADPDHTEFVATEPLHSVADYAADSAGADAAPTEIS